MKLQTHRMLVMLLCAGRDKHWIHHLGCPGPAGGKWVPWWEWPWLEFLTEQDRWRSNDEKLVDTQIVKFVSPLEHVGPPISLGLATKPCQAMSVQIFHTHGESTSIRVLNRFLNGF